MVDRAESFKKRTEPFIGLLQAADGAGHSKYNGVARPVVVEGQFTGGRYVGGRTGGVPESIFASGKERGQDIKGKSGRSLKALFFPDEGEVTIKPQDDDKAVFSIKVDDDGRLSMDINNRGADGKPHPDIYPAALVKRSIQFFGDQGREVRTMLGTWDRPTGTEPSVNYDEYVTNLSALGKQPEDITEADKKAAAKNTWTGRLAESLGYTEVRSIHDNPDERRKGRTDIIVQFVKPHEDAVAVPRGAAPEVHVPTNQIAADQAMVDGDEIASLPVEEYYFSNGSDRKPADNILSLYGIQPEDAQPDIPQPTQKPQAMQAPHEVPEAEA